MLSAARLPARWARLRAPRLPQGRHLTAAASPPALAKVLQKHQLSEDVVPSTADATAVARQLQFLELLGVSRGEVLEQTLRRHPPLLDVDPIEVAAPRIDYLLSLGVHEIGTMLRMTPQWLECDLDQVNGKVLVLNVLGIKNISRYITRNPQILHMDMDTQIKPAVLLWRGIRDLNRQKLLSALPANTAFAPVERTQAKLDWFERELGVTADLLGPFLSKEPRVLTFSIEENLKPKLEFLTAQGFPDAAAMMRERPQLFNSSIEESLAPRLEYVLRYARMSQPHALRVTPCAPGDPMPSG